VKENKLKKCWKVSLEQFKSNGGTKQSGGHGGKRNINIETIKGGIFNGNELVNLHAKCWKGWVADSAINMTCSAWDRSWF